MLTIDPSLVCWIIERIQEFHAQEDVAIHEEPEIPHDDWGLAGMASVAEYADDPAYQEIKSNIDELEPEQQVCLVALMWMGRGDFDDNEWQLAFAEAKSNWTAHTAEYLIATPLVSDYLAEGLSMMGYSCDDED